MNLMPAVSSLRLVSKAVFTVSSRNIYKKHFYRGIYITEGMQAYKGDILVRQGRLNYHPGLNPIKLCCNDADALFEEISFAFGVSMKTEYYDKVLRASCNGKVMITTEDVTPNFDLSEVENEYGWKKDVPLKKLTFNVIPDELPGKFRLRETV
uniref:39S ribosomal protein L27, mitochondrial n=1 Tax=Romanomermis culicivorax TaxID=13658 RepID=A0A915L1M2_ROMCU